MTETDKDGEKSDTSKNGKETKDAGAPLFLIKNGEEKNVAPTSNEGKATTQKSFSIGLDKERTIIEIRIPLEESLWKSIGFVHEIVIPWVRKIYIEKAQKSALKNKLISPPKGFRGFNPFKR